MKALKYIKYVEIIALKYVDNVDICWNKYKYQKELK